MTQSNALLVHLIEVMENQSVNFVKQELTLQELGKISALIVLKAINAHLKARNLSLVHLGLIMILKVLLANLVNLDSKLLEKQRAVEIVQ